MADLEKKSRPADFYYKVSHLWILNEDGKVEAVERRQFDKDNENWKDNDENWDKPAIHADYWGCDAWDIHERGYYSEEFGMVTCHTPMKGDLLKKVARKFKNAIYYSD